MNKKGQNPQKLRLLYLAKILLEETDDEHSLTHAELDAKLTQLGFKETDRGTFTDDILQLTNFGTVKYEPDNKEDKRDSGFEIIREKEGREYRYHIGARTFELPELKIIVDIIQSSRFISEKKSQELIEKLKSLVSKYEAEALNQQVYVKGRIKSDNYMNFRNTDLINKAINEKKIISFMYFDNIAKRTINKNGGVEIKIEKIYRHNKKIYEVSPWSLISNNQNYYMIGTEDNVLIKHYRVDRMTGVKLTDEHAKLKLFKGTKISDYAEKRFDMFDGQEERVVLKIEDSMYPIIADKFGKSIDVEVYDDTHFLVKATVCISDQFLAWILSLGNGIRIEGPDSAVKRVKNMLNERANLYGL